MRDAQFELCVNQLAEALSLVEVRFSFGASDMVIEAIVSLYDAFATPEPGHVSRASKGLVP